MDGACSAVPTKGMGAGIVALVIGWIVEAPA
jgi:hypothetical protein